MELKNKHKNERESMRDLPTQWCQLLRRLTVVVMVEIGMAMVMTVSGNGGGEAWLWEGANGGGEGGYGDGGSECGKRMKGK